MTPAELKDALAAARKSGYALGYSAGTKRVDREAKHAGFEAQRQALLDAAFTAALPFALNALNWQMDGKDVKLTEDRIELAWRIAKMSLQRRKYA